MSCHVGGREEQEQGQVVDGEGPAVCKSAAPLFGGGGGASRCGAAGAPYCQRLERQRAGSVAQLGHPTRTSCAGSAGRCFLFLGFGSSAAGALGTAPPAGSGCASAAAGDAAGGRCKLCFWACTADASCLCAGTVHAPGGGGGGMFTATAADGAKEAVQPLLRGLPQHAVSICPASLQILRWPAPHLPLLLAASASVSCHPVCRRQAACGYFVQSRAPRRRSAAQLPRTRALQGHGCASDPSPGVAAARAAATVAGTGCSSTEPG